MECRCTLFVLCFFAVGCLSLNRRNLYRYTTRTLVKVLFGVICCDATGMVFLSCLITNRAHVAANKTTTDERAHSHARSETYMCADVWRYMGGVVWSRVLDFLVQSGIVRNDVLNSGRIPLLLVIPQYIYTRLNNNPYSVRSTYI